MVGDGHLGELVAHVGVFIGQNWKSQSEKLTF